MESLSKRQKQVYEFIDQYHTKQGIAPTIAEVARGIGTAHSTAAIYIDALKHKGFATSLEGIPRSLKVVGL